MANTFDCSDLVTEITEKFDTHSPIELTTWEADVLIENLYNYSDHDLKTVIGILMINFLVLAEKEIENIEFPELFLLMLGKLGAKNSLNMSNDQMRLIVRFLTVGSLMPVFDLFHEEIISARAIWQKLADDER